MLFREITTKLEQMMPLAWQEDYDNSGLQMGDPGQQIHKVVFALDLCREVLRFAIEQQADLIIVHHPLFMRSFKQIDFSCYEGDLVRLAVRHNLAIYAAHTNHDASTVSLARNLAAGLGLTQVVPLKSIPNTDAGVGIMGRLEPARPLADYARRLLYVFQTSTCRIVGRDDRIVKRVAFCNGSGMGLLNQVIQDGCDLFITGDIKYHGAVEALRHNVALIDIGHFASEVKSVSLLKSLFQQWFGTSLQLFEYEGLRDPFRMVSA